MEDIFYGAMNYAVMAIGAILLFLISKFALGLLIVRFILKIAVVAVVAYLSVEMTNWLMDLLAQYMPIENPIMAFACQIGLFDGINLFFKIAFTAYSSKLIIRTVISA